MAKRKRKQFTEEDDALLAELGVEPDQKKAGRYTPRQERIIAGFEDIQRFVAEHGRGPQHGEDRDIFERLYAVRLDRIRASKECMELLQPMDEDGLLGDKFPSDAEEVSDDELLEALGAEAPTEADDIRDLKHVRPQPDRKAPKKVAQRKPCSDFETFRPIFQRVQRGLEAGTWRTEKFKQDGKLERGDLFILDGQKVLIADIQSEFVTEFGREDGRLRVIFDNGTESDLLRRSLQRALYKDAHGRRILSPNSETAPLFSGEADEDDVQAGTVYVLRSLSDHPFIKQHRKLIHKIGVTGGDVTGRLGNTKKDPTFLLAEVEVVATFKLANINRRKLEKLLHRIFEPARLDLELKDRFDAKVEPREWFLVPIEVINQAIEKLKDGSISQLRYDPGSARLQQV